MDDQDRPEADTLAGLPIAGEVSIPPPPGTVSPEATAGPTDDPGATIGREPGPHAGRALPSLPGFDIEAEVGRGGMGVVYRARHVRLNRTVAIKMILAGDHAGAEASRRFIAEAESIARLQHPNIVQIFHINEHQGRPYFEMEYVAGGSLAERLDGQPRPPRVAARLVGQLARAAAEAHRSGIVHRDLKPSNILLGADGAPKVADFGLAKRTAVDSGLTRTDSILGSPSYMAPEQAEGHARDVGAAADVYALGAILYEQLTGRPPFVGATVLDTLQQVKGVDPVPPSRLVHGLPRDVETIALKCLEKSPARRYATAADLAADLDRFVDGEPIVARPVPFWERGAKWAARRPAIAALGLALAALSAALLMVGVVSYARIQAALGEAQDERARALAARNEESRSRSRAEDSRERADAAREAALAETYRASLSEARALRAAHQPGWRDAALGNLARLASLPTPRRDPAELRTEAVACLGDFDIREVARLDDSKGLAFGLAFLGDGRTLATAHRNGVVHLWDADHPAHRAVVPGDGPVGTWDYPGKGEPWPLVLRRPDGDGLVYNPRGHGAVFLGPDLRPDRPPIDRRGMNAVGLAFDATGRRIAIGWADRRVEVFEAATGARLVSEAAFNARVVALSPDGRRLALLGSDRTIRLRHVGEPGPAVTLGPHRQSIRSVAFSPDGATLAAASIDGTVMLWDVARGETRFPLLGHKGPVTCVAYSPDGAWIATGSGDITARLWDARSGRELALLPQDQEVTAVAFGPGGDTLATSCIFTRSAHLYRINGGRERRRLAGHALEVKKLAYHPRLSRLVSGDAAGELILWDSIAGVPIRRWRGHSSAAQSVTFSPDGSILAAGHYGAVLRLWDAEGGSLLRELTGHKASVSALAFDRAGARIASGGAGGRVLFHEVATGAQLPPEHSAMAWIHNLAFTGDERGLLAATSANWLWLFDLAGAAPPRSITTSVLPHMVVADPGRSRALVGELGGGLAAVSVPDLKVALRVEGHHQERIIALALSPDGTLVASGGADGRVVLSDAATLRPLLRFPRRTGWVHSLAFDAVGGQLAVGGGDADVELWDLGLIRGGLEAAGLAWDRATPTVDPGSALGPPPGSGSRVVPLISDDNVDPAEVARALEVRRRGVLELQAGRAAEAVVSLREAVDRHRRLARADPANPRRAGQLANVVGWLGGALATAGRHGEARAATEESRAILEGIAAPAAGELYDLACAYARLSVTPAGGGEAALADRAVATLRRSIDAGLRPEQDIAADSDFDPIRGRADFRALLLDRKFPVDPFAPR